MKLSELLKSVRSQGQATAAAVGPGLKGDPEIAGIFCRAQEVVPGGLFVAIPGFSVDGHDFIAQAVARGAAVIVCQRPVSLKEEGEAIVFQVNASRLALAELAAAYYGHPSSQMTLIGITGTNGKTTTSYLIESILQSAGISVGVIGTINYRYGGRLFDNPVTTPDALDLQRILAEMHSAGITHVVMEVSSHALDLHRVHACAIDLGVFTNLTQDHLDYHHDMDTYWASKRRLFTDILSASDSSLAVRAVINRKDPKGRELADTLDLPYLTTGLTDHESIWARTARFSLQGVTALIQTSCGELEVNCPLVGGHNLENMLNAVGAGIALDIPLSQIASGIAALDNVPGRLERVANTHQRFVYVDYAHTPDALENVLKALRALTTDRIICVFGCGGDRDRGKRPQMGEIAWRISDLAVVTSDNPRTELPGVIIDQILTGLQKVADQRQTPQQVVAGFNGKGFVVEPDRRKAIALSIQASRPGDTILIAGKGHETYQILGRVKYPFDDRLEASKVLDALNG